MNDVANISANPFRGLSYSEKKQIIKLGPPVPDLNVIQTVVKGRRWR